MWAEPANLGALWGVAAIGYFTCLRHYFLLTLLLSAAVIAANIYPVWPDVTAATAWVGLGLVMTVAACLRLILFGLPNRKPQASRKPQAKRKASAKSNAAKGSAQVVIDGTNVIYWDNETPSLDTLRAVVDRVKAKGMMPMVFLDASSRHHLKDKSLSENDFSHALGLDQNHVVVCPAQTEADAFILKYAKEHKLAVISNDRFRDRAQQVRNVKLIKGVIANGKPVLNGF